MRSRLRSSLGLVLAAALASGTLAQLASAPAALAQQGTAPSALIVLDVSGSMAARGAGGTTLVEQARAAVSSTVAALPAGSQVGLRVYGSEVGSEESNKAAGCQDSRLLVPVGPLDAAAVNAAVGSVQPKGWTPIGLALQQGAKDLPGTGPRTIVLVSDGLDTCAPPDPCEVAKQLSADGVPVKVEAIGFNLPAGDPARGQLQCIAGATGGEYRDAADAGQLAAALTSSSQRALRGFQAAGTVAGGTASPVGAPVLTLDGSDVRDTVAPGQAKYYALPTAVDDRPEVTVTLGNDQPGTVADKSCRAELSTTLLSTTTSPVDTKSKYFDGRESVTVVNKLGERTNAVVPLSKDASYPNYAAGTWYLKVELKRQSCSGGQPPLPQRDYQVQLSVKGLTTAAPAALAAVVAGSASTNAPLITSGTPVRDTLRLGETAWYAVDVPTGHRLRALALVGGDPAATDNACTAAGTLRIVNSAGNPVDSDSFSFAGRLPAGAETVTSSTEAVGETKSDSSSIAKAGKYFVTVALASGSSCTGKLPVSDLEYPVRVEAQTVAFTAPATATPTASTEAPQATAEAAPADADSGTSPWVWVALGVVLLGAAAVAIVVVLLRRPSTAAHQGLPPQH